MSRIDGIDGESIVVDGNWVQLLRVIVNVGTFCSLNVPAERRADFDALIGELEKARDRASS